jgi:D-serine deaminase-like pyridoxal phosphate-dependent protein
MISGSGTGTYDIDSEVEAVTEMQVGSYALMDAEYAGIGSADNPEGFRAFLPALTLLTTVISTNHPDWVTVDAGLKALYCHGGTPYVPGREDLAYEWFGDEHGKLLCADPQRRPKLGEVVELVVSHCDPTVNLFDEYFVVRGEEVVDRWPIDLRGCSQ